MTLGLLAIIAGIPFFGIAIALLVGVVAGTAGDYEHRLVRTLPLPLMLCIYATHYHWLSPWLPVLLLVIYLLVASMAFVALVYGKKFAFRVQRDSIQLKLAKLSARE